jgi:ferredoxin, 2Fe-2S
MPLVTFVDATGTHHDREIPVGTSVMTIARSTGVPGIVAECGGNLTCASCHVLVDDWRSDYLPQASADEDEMLDEVAVGRQPNSRLSCQLILTEDLDGLVVRVPERQQ